MNNKERFKDKVVIVTGASSGIGKASALEFAREGAKTVLVSRSAEKLERVADEIRGFNPSVLVVPTDITLRGQVHEMVEEVLSQFGRIDVLFNNAGSSYNSWSLIGSYPAFSPSGLVTTRLAGECNTKAIVWLSHGFHKSLRISEG